MDNDIKLAKDLAIAYTTAKLKFAITKGFLSKEELIGEELEYFRQTFENAYGYFVSCGTIIDYCDNNDE